MLEHTKLRHFWAQIVSWATRHARYLFIVLGRGVASQARPFLVRRPPQQHKCNVCKVLEVKSSPGKIRSFLWLPSLQHQCNACKICFRWNWVVATATVPTTCLPGYLGQRGLNAGDPRCWAGHDPGGGNVEEWARDHDQTGCGDQRCGQTETCPQLLCQ